METVVANEGYGWDVLRQELRGAGVHPVSKHHEFDSGDKAHNARHDGETYYPRSLDEATFYPLKRRFGETLRVRTRGLDSSERSL